MPGDQASPPVVIRWEKPVAEMSILIHPLIGCEVDRSKRRIETQEIEAANHPPDVPVRQSPM